MRSLSLSSSPVALKPSLTPRPLLVTRSFESSSVSNSQAFLNACVKGPALTLVAADSIDLSSCFMWLRVRVQNVRARQRATHLGGKGGGGGVRDDGAGGGEGRGGGPFWREDGGVGVGEHVEFLTEPLEPLHCKLQLACIGIGYCCKLLN